MRLVTRLIAAGRSFLLRRQLREVDQIIGALPKPALQALLAATMKDMELAAKCEYPHLYGTPPEQRYLPWGAGADIGYTRAKSDNPQVQLRGLSMWLTVAYLETKDSPYSDIQALHRGLIKTMRQVKDSVPAKVIAKMNSQKAANEELQTAAA